MVYREPQPTYVIKREPGFYLIDFDFKRQLPLFADSFRDAYHFGTFAIALDWLKIIKTGEIETIEPPDQTKMHMYANATTVTDAEYAAYSINNGSN